MLPVNIKNELSSNDISISKHKVSWLTHAKEEALKESYKGNNKNGC